MNFLAHIYLSGDSEELITGNFIADFIKGSQLLDFPPEVVKGVMLHRKIDTFTDNHPIVRQGKERLALKYRKYAPVILDIYYDHFLAVNWDRYSEKKLDVFASDFYDLVRGREEMLPERARQMLPYMIRYNWLVSYSRIEGIERALTGMSRRATFQSDMEKAAEDLRLHYEQFQEEFRSFFPELIGYSREEILKLSR